MEEGGDSQEKNKQSEPSRVREATKKRKEPSEISSRKFNKERNPEREKSTNPKDLFNKVLLTLHSGELLRSQLPEILIKLQKSL